MARCLLLAVFLLLPRPSLAQTPAPRHPSRLAARVDDPPGGLPVHLRLDRPKGPLPMRYFREAQKFTEDSPVFQLTPICTAPCEAWLPRGTYRLALSVGGSAPMLTDMVTVTPNQHRLVGTRDDESATRAGGLAVMLGSLAAIVGMAALFTAVNDAGWWIAQIPVSVVGGIAFLASIPLVCTGDSATIQFD